MIISIIVAMTKPQRVIGLDNKMPWHLPADLAWFKKNTLNKPVIMGHKTFQSIGRPLPNRHNIVVSRALHSNENANVSWVQSIEDAINLAKQQQTKEAFIIGGGSIYQQTLPLANRLYLTHIDANLQGDTCFPDYSPEKWTQIHMENHQPDEQNPYHYQFQILTKND